MDELKEVIELAMKYGRLLEKMNLVEYEHRSAQRKIEALEFQLKEAQKAKEPKWIPVSELIGDTGTLMVSKPDSGLRPVCAYRVGGTWRRAHNGNMPFEPTHYYPVPEDD